MTISYFDVWKKKMENNGRNESESRLKNSKSFFNREFKNDPSYKLAVLKKKDVNVESDLDTRIINVDTDVYKKKIYVRPNTDISNGDYIIYPNKTYLVLSVEDNLVSPYANSTFCNYTLKWIINGEYFEIPAIITNNTKYTLGVKEVSSSFVEGDGMYGIIIAYDSKAKKLALGQRFIVNGQAWEATQLDHSSTSGLLSILLGESSKSTEYDDMQNEIADAFLNSYAISLNSTSESITETSTYQLVANVTNNNVIVSNPSIVWSSSNETIATVNNGLVTALIVGNCVITATIGSVSTTLSLEVFAKTVTPVISYGYNWSNGISLKTYVSSTISLNKTIDSVSSPLVVSYTLSDVGNTLLNTGNISITKKSDYSYQIKNINCTTIKNFIITFTDNSDSSIITSQTINISGM